MSIKPQQWILQADYDMATAEVMISTERYFYAVFMCHLSIEKALKGLYQQKLKELPPKTHNLIYFLNKIGVKSEEDFGKFIVNLNEASVITRYPEDLDQLQKDYTKPIVENIFMKSNRASLSAHYPWVKPQGFSRAESLWERGRGKMCRGAVLLARFVPVPRHGAFARCVVRSY